MCKRALRHPGTKGVLVATELRAFTFSHDQYLTQYQIRASDGPSL